MKGGIGNIMKQAQLMQENMKKLQEQLASMEIEGQAGSGMVKVVMTGRHEVKRVSLDPRALTDDREMLEDLITVAINDAVKKIESVTQEKMAAATAGLPLPPGMKLPF
jgi:nucleoid-associated protein EbfC